MSASVVPTFNALLSKLGNVVTLYWFLHYSILLEISIYFVKFIKNIFLLLVNLITKLPIIFAISCDVTKLGKIYIYFKMS